MARIGTSNVAKELGTKDVNSCGQIAANNTDLCVFQEIYPEDLTPLKNGLGTNWCVKNTDMECVIGFNKSFAKLSTQDDLPAWLTPTGRTKISPGDSSLPNPARFFSWVCFTPIARPDMHPIVLLDSHFTNGAWNDSHPNTKDERQTRWDNEFDAVNVFLTNVHDEALTVIFGGDWNRNPDDFVFKTLDDDVPGRWIKKNAPFDGIGCREGNVDVTYQSSNIVPNASDHDLVVAQVHFDNQ